MARIETMNSAIPRKVFRVRYKKDRTPFVEERLMIARSGSWFTTQRADGSQEKENGNYWSDTIMEALQRECSWIMHRFAFGDPARRGDQLDALMRVVAEAAEWGRLVGMLERHAK